MTSNWQWKVLQLTRRLWIRASLISLLAVASVLVSPLVNPYIPAEVATRIGADAVDRILGILASSMLAVTTFSLSTMVGAHASAASMITPRANRLLREDTTTQNVLATFIGAFLFSLIGVVVLSTGAYDSRDRLVLFAMTVVVIVLIVLALLRWIAHLSDLSRMEFTTAMVECAAAQALLARVRDPFLGAHALRDRHRDIPSHARPLFAARVGYIQHIDVGELSRCMAAHDGGFFVNALPGAFVDPARPLGWSVGIDDEAVFDDLRAMFVVGDERSFDQDPRFGLSVLAEIASRALSPGVNDAGTAIDVIGRAVRVLSCAAAAAVEPPGEVEHARLWVPPISDDDLFDDAFMPIARDGAAVIEVQLCLLKGLAALSRVADGRFRACARRHARLALACAEAAMPLEHDRERIRAAARRLD